MMRLVPLSFVILALLWQTASAQYPGWQHSGSIYILTRVEGAKLPATAMKDEGAGDLKYHWTVSGGAVIKDIVPDKLILKRSQMSGKIRVTLALNNGGADFAATAAISVTEPEKDAWVQRTPGKDEQPEENQFYARDDKNEGTLFYDGTLERAADSVFLRVYCGSYRWLVWTVFPINGEIGGEKTAFRGTAGDTCGRRE